MYLEKTQHKLVPEWHYYWLQGYILGSVCCFSLIFMRPVTDQSQRSLYHFLYDYLITVRWKI